MEVIRSWVWKKAAHLLVDRHPFYINQLREMWLASWCQRLGEGTKKPQMTKNQTCPQHTPLTPSKNRQVMVTKHRLREVPAGKMMKYMHSISKHTSHLLPLFLPSLNAKTTVPLPCIQFGTSLKAVVVHPCSTDHKRTAVW